MKNKLMTIMTVLIIICALTLAFAGCAGGEGEKDDFDNGVSEGGSIDGGISGDNETNGEDDPSEPEDSVPEPPAVSPPAPKPEVTYDVLLVSLTNDLNIRTGRGSSYASLGKIDKGDAVAKIGSAVDGWYKTVYKERTAYVSAKYVKEMKFEKSQNAKVEKVLEEGKKLLGYPYVWGSQRYHWGNGKLNPDFKAGQFDCSALMQYIYYHGASVNLELTTRTQVLQGKEVKKSDLRRGDLMFFTNAERKHYSGIERIGHVAVYLGNNYILHTASDYAVIEEISSTRWSYYEVSKRLI